jgi:hypothetical protein
MHLVTHHITSNAKTESLELQLSLIHARVHHRFHHSSCALFNLNFIASICVVVSLSVSGSSNNQSPATHSRSPTLSSHSTPGLQIPNTHTRPTCPSTHRLQITGLTACPAPKSHRPNKQTSPERRVYANLQGTGNALKTE